MVDCALDHALAQAAVLDVAFLEGPAEVVVSEGQDEVWSDRCS